MSSSSPKHGVRLRIHRSNNPTGHCKPLIPLSRTFPAQWSWGYGRVGELGYPHVLESSPAVASKPLSQGLPSAVVEGPLWRMHGVRHSGGPPGAVMPRHEFVMSHGCVEVNPHHDALCPGTANNPTAANTNAMPPLYGRIPAQPTQHLASGRANSHSCGCVCPPRSFSGACLALPWTPFPPLPRIERLHRRGT